MRKDRLLEFDLKPHRKSMSRRSLIHNVADNSITGATEYVCVNGYVCVNVYPAETAVQSVRHQAAERRYGKARHGSAGKQIRTIGEPRRGDTLLSLWQRRNL